ncbi:MAG: DUF748 domain-containing protein [Magnetococcales bacterium]|nr:DUF748 domain-containing protein [Magnetococcales bacterium]
MIRFFTFILVALILALAFMPLETPSMLDVDRYRERIRQMVETISGHKVQIERVDYNPLNGLFTLELYNLEIEASDPDNPPLISAPKVFLGIRAISLLLHRPELVTITLVNPLINIVGHGNMKLLDRAQDKARVSNRNMTQELGWGLTGLTLGKVSIQNGMITFIDPSKSTEGPLIIDHIHLNLHALSPSRASPLTATARIHNIPFTINGQVGPLPASLDPMAMPLLLSLDAKSTGLADFNDLFPDSHVQARLSRGYLTTMLHGTLESGLQTSSWVQLDGLELANPDPLNPKGKATLWNLGVGRAKKDGPRTMDIAFRQKSLLRVTQEEPSTLEFDELFIHVDGKPMVQTRGRIDGGIHGGWDLEFILLNSMDFSRLPLPRDIPLSGGTPTGHVFVKGSWPSGGEFQGKLDFAPMTVQPWAFFKGETNPLTLTARGEFSSKRFFVKESRLSVSDDPGAWVAWTGQWYPSLELHGTVQWPLARLAEQVPLLLPLKPSGNLDLVLKMTRDEAMKDRIEGVVRVGEGRMDALAFSRFEAPFLWVAPELRLPHIEVHTEAGRIDGYLDLIAREGGEWVYSAMIHPTGVLLEKLPAMGREADPRLEGVLFGALSVQGALASLSTMEHKNMMGHGMVHLRQGRVVGMDPTSFLKPPTEEMTLSPSERSLSWDHARAWLRWDQQGLRIERMKIASSDFTMNGRGWWKFKDRYGLDLHVQNTLPPWGGGEVFAVRVEGDDITRGLRLVPSVRGMP